TRRGGVPAGRHCLRHRSGHGTLGHGIPATGSGGLTAAPRRDTATTARHGIHGPARRGIRTTGRHGIPAAGGGDLTAEPSRSDLLTGRHGIQNRPRHTTPRAAARTLTPQFPRHEKTVQVSTDTDPLPPPHPVDDDND
ncbi:hypothetical protein, partial [Fodinibacter luteus]|uniref:hypothetical protein n=1 Tax=Fodinibacter luteus TaxID=552064 RepID=UPI0031EF3B0A